MMRSILIFIAFLSFGVAQAQDDCACCSAKHHQFDFWVGDWNVYDTLGNKIGENRVEKLENGCIINENWKGAQGGSGKSYNYFNRSDSTWNQLWIDSEGNNLELKGYATDQQMSLTGELKKGQKVAWYANRITWTKNEDGSVTQLWEIIDEHDQVLNVAFKGIYQRK